MTYETGFRTRKMAVDDAKADGLDKTELDFFREDDGSWAYRTKAEFVVDAELRDAPASEPEPIAEEPAPATEAETDAAEQDEAPALCHLFDADGRDYGAVRAEDAREMAERLAADCQCQILCYAPDEAEPVFTVDAPAPALCEPETVAAEASAEAEPVTAEPVGADDEWLDAMLPPAKPARKAKAKAERKPREPKPAKEKPEPYLVRIQRPAVHVCLRPEGANLWEIMAAASWTTMPQHIHMVRMAARFGLALRVEGDGKHARYFMGGTAPAPANDAAQLAEAAD